MRPRGLMILGAVLFAFAAVFALFNAAPSVMICAFMGGMMFGKGYGVWEERSRAPKPQRPPDAWFYYDEDED